MSRSAGALRGPGAGAGRAGLVWLLAGAGVALAQGPPSERVLCTAGQTSGVPVAAAETAVALVCAEVARESRGAAGDYRVDLRPLGHGLILVLSRDDTSGARTLWLESLEELPVAAQRVAEALVRGLTLEETRRVDNLLASETRSTPLRQGSLRPSLAILGLGSVGHAAPVGASFGLGRLHRARLRVSVRADVPTRKALGFDSCDWDPRASTCVTRPRPERYVLPVTFGLGVSF